MPRGLSHAYGYNQHQSVCDVPVLRQLYAFCTNGAQDWRPTRDADVRVQTMPPRDYGRASARHCGNDIAVGLQTGSHEEKSPDTLQVEAEVSARWPYGGQCLTGLAMSDAHGSDCISIFREVTTSTKRRLQRQQRRRPTKTSAFALRAVFLDSNRRVVEPAVKLLVMRCLHLRPHTSFREGGRPVRPRKNSAREKVFLRRIRPSFNYSAQQQCAFSATLTSYLALARKMG